MRLKIPQAEKSVTNRFGWYRYFAKKPVRVFGGEIVWLKWVMRRGHPFGKRELDGYRYEYHHIEGCPGEPGWQP